VTTHTPGPWTVGQRHGANTHVTGPRSDPTGRPYRTIPGIVVAFVQSPEDAALIAAAPDLLDQLKEMAAQHRCGCGHPSCRRCADDRENDRVIAMAKGRRAPPRPDDAGASAEEM
jgi:hypothetical protein